MNLDDSAEVDPFSDFGENFEVGPCDFEQPDDGSSSHEDSLELEIEEKIEALREQVKNAVNDLILHRITRLTNESPVNIANFDVTVLQDDWWIEYEHHTENFDSGNYLPEEFFESRKEIGPRTTLVKLGFEDGCFILEGYKEDMIDIYRRGEKLTGINSLYLCQLSRTQQEELIESYSNNVDVPEWFALKFILSASKKNLSDQNIIKILRA
jgi:hypothetical protein